MPYWNLLNNCKLVSDHFKFLAPEVADPLFYLEVIYLSFFHLEVIYLIFAYFEVKCRTFLFLFKEGTSLTVNSARIELYVETT